MNVEKMKQLEKENNEMLTLFHKRLKEAGLSDKTIRRQVNDMAFFLNDYLLDVLPDREWLEEDEVTSFREGPNYLDDFLGDFFIRKCMWSSPGTIRSMSTSIKKFYACMAKEGKIEEEVYTGLCSEIKENIGYWQDSCRAFDEGRFGW